MKVCGIMHVNGTASSGAAYSGWKIHCLYPINPDKGKGEAAFNFFINDNKLVGVDLPNLGDEIETSYNRFGKVGAFTITKRASK